MGGMEQYVYTSEEKPQPRPLFRASDFCGFVGQSAAMQTVYTLIRQVAPSDAPVLINGETGTGKELAAEALHRHSQRRDQEFVIINCAAIPKDLLESEIFGHTKGAFTGAMTDHEGAAQRAHRGTLFLDEITEMPYDMQAKILRFVQSGSFTPVGGTQARKADIRFIAATNRPPLAAIGSGHLREDLYYRLAAVTLSLPPLRARGDDIMLLARYYLQRFAQQEKRRFDGFSPKAEELLCRHAWKGNVRELENVMRRIVLLCKDSIIDEHMLNLEKMTEEKAVDEMQSNLWPLADIERQAIEKAIKHCSGNITEAARLLEINPSTIHRKQKEWASQP